MSRIYWFLLLISGCAPAMAGEKEDLESTVHVTVTWAVDGSVHAGSGVPIGVSEHKALIATASHLFPADGRVRAQVRKGRGDFSAYMVARQDGEYDLAVLAVNGDTKFRPVVICTDVPSPDQPLYYTGCAMGREPTHHRTTVVPWDASNRVVAVSGIVEQGQSGGGLFNADGELVGICSGFNPFGDRRQARRSIFATSRQLVVMLDKKD